MAGKVWSGIMDGEGEDGEGMVYSVTSVPVREKVVRRRSPLGRTAMFSIQEGFGSWAITW